jgi:CheY-like chemotaxis protein
MTPRPGPAVLTDTEPPRILLVDDEASGRHLLRRWVERCFDARVAEANSGLEALEALAAQEFDLVVLDLFMPVLDGVETLTLIRSDSSHGDIEVVMISEIAAEQTVKEVISLGVAAYILKPLRYESVADHLRQVIEQIRQKKRERLHHSGLPIVLIADPDPNFCDFAISALAGHFRGLAVRSAAEALVGVLKNEPDLILLNPALPGLPFEILSQKTTSLAEAHHGKVCLLADPSSPLTDGFAGRVARTFVPESFCAEVANLLAVATCKSTHAPWLKALEPEVASAVHQAIGMMTGSEPSSCGKPSGDVSPDLFVVMDLRAQSGAFDLLVDLRCQRSFAVALCGAMLGGEMTGVDSEVLLGGVGEILNVVSGRIKNSCANRKIEVLLNLPQFRESAPHEPNAFYTWEQYFLWQGNHYFRLGVTAAAGATSPVS